MNKISFMLMIIVLYSSSSSFAVHPFIKKLALACGAISIPAEFEPTTTHAEYNYNENMRDGRNLLKTRVHRQDTQNKKAASHKSATSLAVTTQKAQ